MAFKDTLADFFDIGLAEVFARKQVDPSKGRKALLAGIDNAKRQFEGGQTKAPNRWWKVSNGVVALTVKLKGDTFEINGVETNHMPQERFPEFLEKFRAAVEAGEFDKELENHGSGDGRVHIAKAPRVARKPGGGGNKTWTDERRARFAETVAARRAARAA